uniref:Apple domain-containing protein n=1 Tax=Parastrongyloides trichosuri TaxID=131310 RepID=A0A0N4ZKC3_PARTI
MTKVLSTTIFFIFFNIISSTTEWFGDLRAQYNPLPAREEPFYDVMYDDTVCPQGLKSKAIPEYVYFGAMVASFATNDKNECLQSCVTNSKCKAVNFFEPIKRKDKGFCELLGEDQYDNPRLLRSFKKATYYENVACRSSSDNDSLGISKAKVVIPVLRNEKKKHESIINAINSKDSRGYSLTMLKKIADKIHEFNSRFRS